MIDQWGFGQIAVRMLSGFPDNWVRGVTFDLIDGPPASQ